MWMLYSLSDFTHFSPWWLHRYEVYVCKGKQSEKVAAGHLEHLLPHLPEMNDLCTKGFNANLDLKLPKDLHGAKWFSKITVIRFISKSGLFFIFHCILLTGISY